MTMLSENFVPIMKSFAGFLLFLCVCLFAGSGCTAGAGKRGKVPEEKLDISFEGMLPGDSARYEYLLSQIYLHRGQLHVSENHLKKAIEKDPDSSFLQRSLIRLYLSMDEKNQDFRDLALTLAHTLAREHPRDVENLLLLMDVDKKQPPEELSRLLSRILELDPKHRETWLRLGRLYMEMPDISRAENLFSRMSHELPNDYAAWFYLGEACMKNRKFHCAQQAFLKSIEQEPDLLEARFRLAEIVRQKPGNNTFKHLQDLYLEILEIDPKNFQAKMELFLLYSRQGKNKQADQLFDAFAGSAGENPHMVMLAADYFISSKRSGDGAVVFSRLCKVLPGTDLLYFFSGMVHESAGDIPTALEWYKKISPSLPQYKKVVLNIAILYRDMDQWDNAIDFLQERHRQQPNDTDIILYLLAFYDARGHVGKALSLALESVKKQPENTSLLFRLGELYDRNQDISKCIETMKRLIDLAPKDANALNYLGYTYAQTGQNLDKALNLVQRALAIRPEDGYIVDSLGWVYFQKGDYETAVIHLKKAARMTRYEPIIADHLAQAYLKIKQPDRAIEVYQKAASLAQGKKKQKQLVELNQKIQALKARKKDPAP